MNNQNRTTPAARLVVDGKPVEYIDGDNLLVTMLKADTPPTQGGCLCMGGDCPHCLATVDGVSYIRTCQVQPYPGMIVERDHHQHDGGTYPPLHLDVPAEAEPVPVRNLHCDVVVIGMGTTGMAEASNAEAAGKHVITLDANHGQEVMGIYAGPEVVARVTSAGEREMWFIHPEEEIVIATGAAEIQPVAEGNHLAGIVTAYAAEQLAAAGVELGEIVAVGEIPVGLNVRPVLGDIVRFEENGGSGQVGAVVIQMADGGEERIPCDTVAVGLGLHPRDALVRMANGTCDAGMVRVVGDAGQESDIPKCPTSGMVCHCAGVSVADLDFIWEQGFEELELVKRATLAGTGTCQGSACLPYIRSFLADRGEELQAPFTARPMTRQLTLGEVSAGAYNRATPRTGLDGEHQRLGAQMDRIGGWWRPWVYPGKHGKKTRQTHDEYWAVREAVSIGDVSTLGKMLISGPDALELLERLYPTQVSTIKPGRSRYVLILNERGYVLDDGLIACDDETHYTLTFTSGGATMMEVWVRDWAESWGLDVRIFNQTLILGAINITGPLAPILLARAGLTKQPRFMRHTNATVAGVDCKVFRLSFTGEISFELHHDAKNSVTLWRRLMALGKDLGIKPHGLETLMQCRLDKGHIIVGQDTDLDSTPRRIHHEWMVKLDKQQDFVGKQAVIRTNKEPLNRQLVGLEMTLGADEPAPYEGAILWHGDEYAGYLTSSSASPVLGKAVMLGWLILFDGELPTEVTVDGRAARRVDVPFYDPESQRARAKVDVSDVTPVPLDELVDDALAEVIAEETALFQRVSGIRVVSTTTAIDALLQASFWQSYRQSDAPLPMRTAPDELFVLGDTDIDALIDGLTALLEDPHAIIVPDSGFAGAWIDAALAHDFLEQACPWVLPAERPAFAQGMIADLPVKLWLEEDLVLFLVPAPFATDLEKRASFG